MVPSMQSFFLLLWIMVVVFLCAINSVKSNDARNTPTPVPGCYIVEFASSWTRVQTGDHHEMFYQNVAKTKAVVVPSQKFASSIFTGASFCLNNQDDLAAIDALDSVSHIWPVVIYYLPTPRIDSILDSLGFDNLSVAEITISQYAPHIMTGVDKLHAQGYTGKNVSIAIVDSGADYMHPALGGGFGPGYKFQFGRDLVGDYYTGSNLPTPGPYPLDCNGHGTHVSGIIGANAPMFTGVAPNATLGMYRVFGCYGGSANDILIAAFIAAHDSGAQIITASLGGASGWTQDPLAVVVNRIAATGVSCTIAAGNSGSNGLFYLSTPATSIDGIAVGSVDSITTPQFVYEGYFSINSGVNSTFQYLPVSYPFSTIISGYPLYPGNFNTSNSTNNCTEFPSNTSVLSSSIVLIYPGTCSLSSKIASVLEAGALYVIYYNDGSFNGSTPGLGGYLAAISPQLSAQLITTLQQGRMINFYFSNNATKFAVQSPNNVTGGTMSTFSSWSPTYELYIKPEISAPGGNILSTYPLNMGAYAVLSGTSMATPYMAGVLALYKSANNSQNKIIDYKTLKQIVATTATPVFFNDGTQTYPYLAPVVQQGGGLVNAFAIIHYTTVISPSILALNDTVNFNSNVQFIINNTISTSVSYTITHQPAATAYTFGVNTTYPQNFPPDLNTQYATAIISPSGLTIPGQNVAVISVTFMRPTMLDTTRIPVFSGYINIQSSMNETFNLPYAGIGSNMKEVMVTDFNLNPPYVYNSSDYSFFPSPIGANTTFNLTTDLPAFNWVLAMGSSLVRLDILGNGNQTTVAGVNILGSAPGFPRYWLPRNDLTAFYDHYSDTWNGTLDTGAQLPAGNYTLFYRALKIFGDQNNNDDYENWTSPMFGIVYGYEGPLNITNNITNSTTNSTTNNKAMTEAIYNIKLSFFLIFISFLFIFNQ